LYRFGVTAAYCSNFGHYIFEPRPLPHLGGLATTYDVHLRLIGKRIVDFLLVLIELFSLGVTAMTEYSVQNRQFHSNRGRAGWPKISHRRGCPPPTFLRLRKV